MVAPEAGPETLKRADEPDMLKALHLKINCKTPVLLGNGSDAFQ
jgi:hypothetical protein